ncbi:MAG: Appr-1-p processing protein [Gemmatimonadetes bacterium]|nr:MAG: Appr-1-p processing protein [Gemmatimonadota bacterium]
MPYFIEGVEVKLVLGDLTEADVEAIVNSECDQLTMARGVSGAIRMRGGETIYQALQEHGKGTVGEAILTSGGDLNAQHVIHAIIMDTDFTTDMIKIRECTQNCLNLANEHRYISIAFPAFGTGVGDYPPDLCAQNMLSEIRSVLQTHREAISIKEIRFYLHNQAVYDAFEEELKKQL